MITKSFLLMGAMLIAAPLAAQQNTQCTTTFGVTNCTTTGQPNSGGANRTVADPNAFQRGYDQSRRAVDSVTESFRQAERDRAQRQMDMAMIRQAEQAQSQSNRANTQQLDAQALGIRAGQMVASGDCAGAQKLALDAGDFQLASAVKEYCAR